MHSIALRCVPDLVWAYVSRATAPEYTVPRCQPREMGGAMSNDAASASYRFGRCELQPGQQRLLVEGQAVAVGPRAFELLVALVERAGQLVSKDDLLARVWPKLVVEENNLQVQVFALRKILGSAAIVVRREEFGEFRRHIAMGDSVRCLAVMLPEHAEIGAAKAQCFVEHRLEYRRKIAGRVVDDPQHLGRRGLPFARRSQLCLKSVNTCLHLSEGGTASVLRSLANSPCRALPHIPAPPSTPAAITFLGSLFGRVTSEFKHNSQVPHVR